MKTQYFTRASIARGAAALLILPFQMLPVAEGSTQPQDIEVADIARLCVRVNKIGATGIGKVIGTEGETRYEIDGSELKVYLAPVDRLGEMTVVVDGTYGEIKLHEVIFVDVKNDAESEVEISPYIFSAIAAGGGGGGADYKTDIYMDGAGRVILERLSDGSTLLLDEHENPIVKRNADGSTQFFDAYQSARLLMDAHGDIAFNGNVSGAGMEQYILGIQGGKFVHGTEQLTFAQVKAAVEDATKFVYLDFANAFHLPSFIVDAEGNSAVAFSSAFTIDGKPHIERVVINEQEDIKVDNYTILATNEDGGVAFGEGIATGDGSFAHGVSDMNKTFSFECHKLTDEEREAVYNATGIDYEYCDFGDNFNDEYGSSAVIYADEEFTREVAKVKLARWVTGKEGVEDADYFMLMSGSLEDGVEYYGRYEKIASGYYSHAEGYNTTASGEYSHAEGDSTTASGVRSHAEGDYTTASGSSSHAEGNNTTASGEYSHAEGDNTTASGEYSHAEGANTTASGYYSHAEGYNTTASGEYSHAEGDNTTASGVRSHAEGDYTTASGYYSHAEGDNTTASGYYSHAQGVYNNPDDANEDGAFSHGCGTSNTDRKNSVLFVGDKVYILGVGGYDGTNHNDEDVKDLATVIAGL